MKTLISNPRIFSKQTDLLFKVMDWIKTKTTFVYIHPDYVVVGMTREKYNEIFPERGITFDKVVIDEFCNK